MIGRGQIKTTFFIPGLRFADGQSNWKIFDSEMNEYRNHEEVPERFRTQIHPGQFFKSAIVLGAIYGQVVKAAACEVRGGTWVRLQLFSTPFLLSSGTGRSVFKFGPLNAEMVL